MGRGAVCLRRTQQRTWLGEEISFLFFFFLILVLWRSMVRVRSTERACIWFLLHVTQELKVFGLLVDM